MEEPSPMPTNTSYRWRCAATKPSLSALTGHSSKKASPPLSN